jgi:Ca-activated chloride channel family protein
LSNPSSDVSIANTYYNQGNANLKAGKLEEAVISYKNALRKNSKHEAARYNLSYAQSMLKQQNQKNKNNQDQNNKKQQKDKQKEKEGENGQKQEGDKGKKEQNKGNQQDNTAEKKQKNDAQPEALKKGELSKEQAEQLLKSLEDNEKAIQKKMIQKELKRKKIEKDW